MHDAHPSELAAQLRVLRASSSREREAECAARRVGRASFYKIGHWLVQGRKASYKDFPRFMNIFALFSLSEFKGKTC
jgi:hypothetical protein